MRLRAAGQHCSLCSMLPETMHVSHHHASVACWDLVTKDCNRVPGPRLHMQAKWRKETTADAAVDCACW